MDEARSVWPEYCFRHLQWIVRAAAGRRGVIRKKRGNPPEQQKLVGAGGYSFRHLPWASVGPRLFRKGDVGRGIVTGEGSRWGLRMFRALYQAGR